MMVNSFSILEHQRKIFTTNVLKTRNRSVFLSKPPFDNKSPLLDNFTILAFLSTFNDSEFHFTQTQSSQITICHQNFTHCMDISYKMNKLFRVRYQKSSNYFVIQILNTSNISKMFEKKEVKFNINNRNVYIYIKPPIEDPYCDSPIKLQKNSGISEMSDFYDNSGVDRSCQNQVTTSIFYSVAPFTSKTVSRN